MGGEISEKRWRDVAYLLATDCYLLLKRFDTSLIEMMWSVDTTDHSLYIQLLLLSDLSSTMGDKARVE
jgi:hypothetical protein